MDLISKKEIDVDILYRISMVKGCLNANGKFYIIANKFEKAMGLYLLELDEKKPCEDPFPNFIIKWNNSLEIGDANIYSLEAEEADANVSALNIMKKAVKKFLKNLMKKRASKELVISFK